MRLIRDATTFSYCPLLTLYSPRISPEPSLDSNFTFPPRDRPQLSAAFLFYVLLFLFFSPPPPLSSLAVLMPSKSYTQIYIYIYIYICVCVSVFIYFFYFFLFMPQLMRNKLSLSLAITQPLRRKETCGVVYDAGGDGL
ncbi:hypothetical protein, unlikely [Trypanosoma brucei gambiense DAL972]|uniref:Uncharacterized protein n=1 Tax=Trypanosoma brucei gambiense (strain MHOM/CI/86/DAL972) TaxID=679716 RepID=C9ZU20_TRYB9|nr:hypothetical protein, unlikely [Trypanosoma brucei gambiense DAL972]CBH12906.1 hypothetical protein, unlikely [Trypanosoma brucei gambiense DAL972]|eukprot:XP_011775185.1 hypothetical protein, unlikely [Trypanosoma brucei gambiense DAL972]